MAVADWNAYKAALVTPAARHRRYKAMGISASSIGPWISAWKSPADGASNPSSAASNLDGSTPGSLFAAVQALGVPRLAQADGGSSIIGVVALLDRLAHIGGLSGTVTTAQTVGIGPNSRVTAYETVLAAIEIYSQIGNTATTFTVSYTNEAGTAGRTSVAMAIGGNGQREAQKMIPIPLQEGDRGVKSVETVTLAATTATAGNFGVTLYRQLVLLPVAQRSQPFLWDAMLGGSGNLPDVTNICAQLAYFVQGSGGTGDTFLDLRFIDT